MRQKSLKIIISGGGTGGHIFPAIAIADALKSADDTVQILFIGAKGRMEMEKVPQAGYAIRGLNITGFQRKWAFSNLIFPFRLIFSLFEAGYILRSFRPDVVVGVGGYASGPTLKAAVWLKIPCLIQEQNSYPGITNRLLGSKVNTVCVAYDRMEHWFPTEKIVLTGNPVRKESVDIAGKKEEAMRFFGLEKTQPVVLVIGGSQGALAINRAIIDNLDLFTGNNTQFIWQTGKEFYVRAKQALETAGLTNRIKAHPFIERMDYAYASADLIISRAGAIAIAEISIVSKPVILVPLPTAAEDHQTSNALRLVEAGAAVLVPNSEAGPKLLPTALILIQQPEKLHSMASAIEPFGRPEATHLIVEELIKIAKP
ncbi:undecaprenyldiphospho-muramoylpentapeptide beta-N-acetylglucosaminyltransferase [Bacteroidales bacterium]